MYEKSTESDNICIRPLSHPYLCPNSVTLILRKARFRPKKSLSCRNSIKTGAVKSASTCRNRSSRSATRFRLFWSQTWSKTWFYGSFEQDRSNGIWPLLSDVNMCTESFCTVRVSVSAVNRSLVFAICVFIAHPLYVCVVLRSGTFIACVCNT